MRSMHKDHNYNCRRLHEVKRRYSDRYLCLYVCMYVCMYICMTSHALRIGNPGLYTMNFWHHGVVVTVSERSTVDVSER